MTHDEMIAVIQAHKDGKVIQFKRNCGVCDWTSLAKVKLPHWNFSAVKYRVKPMPKEYWLVPYTDSHYFLVFDENPRKLPPEFNGAGLDFSAVKHVVTVVEDE
jgi:hypothetical protein